MRYGLDVEVTSTVQRRPLPPPLAPMALRRKDGTELHADAAFEGTRGLVEPGGFEPPTSALQRRRSPS